jgi:hypothetical protein
MQSTEPSSKSEPADIPLFGRNPPMTVDVARAARILVDGLLVGHREAAEFHGIGRSSITRLHRIRELSKDLDNAVLSELVATPQNLGTVARLRAWATRPSGACCVEIVDSDGVTVALRRFIPDVTAGE